jgi:hypothetical protein
MPALSPWAMPSFAMVKGQFFTVMTCLLYRSGRPSRLLAAKRKQSCYAKLRRTPLFYLLLFFIL